MKYKENLSITTFGPLTNLAVAFHYEYKVKDIGAVSLLGGQYTGVGNVVGSYSAEANFHFDPHATHIIIHVLFYIINRTSLTTCTSRQSSESYKSTGNKSFSWYKNNPASTNTKSPSSNTSTVTNSSAWAPF